MTCSWTTVRIWPLGHDTAAPPLCDPPLLARRDEEQPNLLAGSAMGQGGLWISVPRRTAPGLRVADLYRHNGASAETGGGCRQRLPATDRACEIRVDNSRES